MDGRGGLLEFGLSDALKELRAIAEEDGSCCYGIPQDVAESSEGGPLRADLVPVGVCGLVERGSDALEPLG